MASATVPHVPPRIQVTLGRHLILIACLLIASIWIKYSVWQLHPQIFNDSPSYLVPALRLLGGQGYGTQEDGFRQPTFPLYLAILLAPLDRTHLSECTDAHRAACLGRAAQFPDGQLGLRVIATANILLGFGILLMLYLLGWRLTHSHAVALLFGAGYAWNVTTAFWEQSILTETFSTFVLVAAILLTHRALIKIDRTRIALGITLTVLGLCYQVFLLYSALVWLMLVLARRPRGWAEAARRFAPVLLIPAAAIGLWSGWNYIVNGVFTPSTVGGYVLIQMVYPVVQNAPEGYDGITQTLVGYRDAQIREIGSPTGAVFRAWRDMMRETDFTYSQVSSKLTTLSLYLIRHYPSVYLSAVVEAWGRFWQFAFFHLDPIPEGVALAASAFADAALQRALNILFWISPLILGGMAIAQSRHGQERISHQALFTVALMSATVWFAAVFSSLTTLGDNSRYRVPVMPLQYGVVVFMGWALLQFARTTNKKRT